MGSLGVPLSRQWISRLLQRLDYTQKVVNYRQKEKFTIENLQYYGLYAVCIQQYPWSRIKYCDESHFRARDLRQPRGWGHVSAPLTVRSDTSLSESYSVTLVTSLASPTPCFISLPREESNTAEDFVVFVVHLICEGVLTAGDIFVADNASVHWSQRVSDTLASLFTTYGIRFVFLPTYSPELNPCEFVFAQVKHMLRQRKWARKNFHASIVHAFASVSFENVFNYYHGCIFLRAR